MFYDMLPCAYWPEATFERAPLAGPESADFPVFVLTAMADPATPYAYAQAIHARTEGSYLVEVVDGGPHVIFGRGHPCVDDVVIGFLVNETLPADARTTCAGWHVDPFLPLLEANLPDYPDVLAALVAIDTEMVALPEVVHWDLTEALEIGCDRGGSLRLEAGDQIDVEFSECLFVEGLPLTGTGTLDLETLATVFEVEVPGGALEYSRNADGARVTGTLNGEPVDLST